MKKLLIFTILLIPFSLFSQDQSVEASGQELTVEPTVTSQPLDDDAADSSEKEAVSGDEKIPVIVDADEIDFQRQAGKVFAKGNVKMSHKDVQLFCDEGIFDVNSNIAYINGNAKVIRDQTVLYGENIVYNFNTYDAQVSDIRVEDSPFYGNAPQGDKIGQEKFILKDGYITTCDLTQPHYRMVSKSITIYPGDKVVARKVVLKVGNVPVFYIPYFSQSLKDKSFPIEVVPGRNDEWGYFMLSRWRYQLNSEHKDWFSIDWYEKRGWGFGVIHKMESKKLGNALAKYYLLQDKLYQIGKRNSLFEIHGDRSGKADKYLEDDRYKAELSYDGEFFDDLSVIAEFHKFSDEYFVKDFFEEEYEANPTPRSYILLRQPLSYSSLSLLAQKRVNRYETMSEYLPQLDYNFFSQQLGDSKFYFGFNEILGNLTKKTANSDLDDDAFRFYSKKTLNYSDQLKWLSIGPWAALTSVYYSKNSFGDPDIIRIGFSSGASLSTRFYRIFNVDWDLFGEEVTKVRHLVTPEVNYSYAHEPTVSDSHIFQFDGYDSLARSETVSFALKNKLQVRTKEDEKWDFVYFSPALNYTIHPEGADSRFTTVTGNLEIYPTENLSLRSDVTYDVDSDGSGKRRITSFNLDFTTKGKYKVFESGKEIEKEKYSFTYGHRYTRVSDTQGIFNISYQLTPKVKLGSYWRYEYNRGDLFEQQYKISTDLHCWWFDFGMDAKKTSVGGQNYTFWFEFRLKAFPDLSISFDAMQENAKSSYYD
ncbi:MAG: hypothetical protein KJ619_07065 [Candidatus Omnitrophica bacterium]|nr:hypothetical protein [Candidatus Omnitrophota bacterium]MBU2473768.1 hypothetical protein [Candidatus Omnitrophota bacterium]